MPTESQKLQIIVKDRSPSTQIKYRGQLARIQCLLGGDIELATWGQILYVLNQVPNPHTRHSYINIIALVRPDLKRDTIALRNENRILVHDHVARTNSLRKPPPFQELLRRRDQAYDQGRWAVYLVQALTIHLGVRTKDLEMEISDVDRQDTTKNHLIRRPGKIELIRNRYKTVKTYRPQRHSIMDPRIVHAANQLPAGPFTTRIVNCHPDRTGEADYFRAQIEHLVAHDPRVLQKIQSLCQTRGSSWEQVVTNYNLRMDATL